jgi:hypothetical protein
MGGRFKGSSLHHRHSSRPLTQPGARDVRGSQQSEGFPMSRYEENREILIGASLFLIFVILLVLYRRFVV